MNWHNRGGFIRDAFSRRSFPYALRWLFFFLVLVASQHLHAQYAVSGRVTDAVSGAPLAFVHVVINQTNRGVVSDIDGRFDILFSEPVRTLQFSYLGYIGHTEYIKSWPAEIEVALQRTALLLPELIVYAGINPAHRIINNAVRNRDLNNYEKIPAFTYTSHDKMVVTLDSDSLRAIDSLVTDTSMINLLEFLDQSHFFILESVVERSFLYPRHDRHNVVATRASGFSDPLFVFLISQLQSTSFYDEVIRISDKNYINPISRGSLSRYRFILEDTLFIDGSYDTTWVISYSPLPNRGFDGLKGVIHINSNGYAIQHVIAEPAESQSIGVRIQQKYELVDGKYWFPSQLNTDLIFRNVEVNGLNPVGKGRSYIRDVVVNPSLDRRKFDEVKIAVSPEATKQSDAEWNLLRISPLTEKEIQTYYFVDSIGREHNFDNLLVVSEYMLGGEIPFGKINIPIRRLLRYNEVEKIYLGIGLRTNQRFSTRVSIGGYVGYGFGDNRIKYGGEISIPVKPERDGKWFISYQNDVVESGRIDPFEFDSEANPFHFRSLLIPRLDYNRLWQTAFQYRVLPYTLARVDLSRYVRNPGFEYFHLIGNTQPLLQEYHFADLSLSLRFAYREKFLQTTRNRISLGTIYPVVWLRYSRGLRDFAGSNFTSNRFDFKLTYSHYFLHIGQPEITLRAGLINGQLPLMQYYSGFSNFGRFAPHAPGFFSTIRFGEFTVDRYVSLSLIHRFRTRLYTSSFSQPELALAAKFLTGSFRSFRQEDHSIDIKTPEKGYYELGLIIENILVTDFSGVGLGFFYRLGPYSMRNFHDNFVMQFEFTLPWR